MVTKSAGLGGDQEGQFEQSFASLAFAYLKDKAPKLLDYMIGFQLVDRNDDNTKAVGIFGFKLGEEWIYAPVFFLNGDLKGHELLYLKKQDQFVPMKENWVNYLLNRQPHILGQGTDSSPQELNVRQPYYGSFNFPPGKQASWSSSDIPPKLMGYIQEAMPLLGAAATKSPALFSKFAGLDSRLNLKSWLAEDVENVQQMMAIFDRYPRIKQAAEHFHGPNLLVEALEALRARALNDVNDAILAPKTAAVRRGPVDVLGRPIKRAAGPKVTIKFDEDKLTTENTGDLSEEEQDKLLRDGMLVTDNREETSQAYNVQHELQLQNPTETGLYDVLAKVGGFKRCLVIIGPTSGSGNQDFATVVDVESKAWLNTHPANLFVRSQESREDFKKWLEGLGKADSFEKGGHYLVLSESGMGSVPFEVSEWQQGGDDEQGYGVYFRDYCSSGRPSYMPPKGYLGRGPSYIGSYDGEPRILVNRRVGCRLTVNDGTLYIPHDSYKLTLKDPPKPKDDDILGCGCSHPRMPGDSSDPTPIQPGNLVDLQAEIMQKTSALKIIDDGIEVQINNGPRLTKRAAMASLIREHGFREATAREMLKQAARTNGARYRVKYAEPYPTGMGPGAPSIPDPTYGFDPSSGAAQAQYPQEEFQPVPDMQAMQPEQSMYDQSMQPDPQAMQAAQQASQGGQKEVFDVSMIGSMLKAVREDSLVDRYLGDLLKALDRLGRILFLFYWHSEEFQDRYGKSDMPELEDSLRNAFESVGDITLYLKQKQIEPFAGAEHGEPEIDETARN